MTNINQPKFEEARKVFDNVFNKYDLMNDLMSLGVHRLWKERLIDWMGPKKTDHLIDMASGTGDIAKIFLKRTKNSGRVTCVDSNNFMLSECRKKLVDYKNVDWVCSPAEKLPFKDNQFDIYTVSFGIRNFSNIEASLEEAIRVLKPGGRIFCLEFSKIDNEILNKLYKMYSKTIPIFGKIIVGKSEPYEYLVKTIDEFYNQDQLLNLFKKKRFL